MARTLRAEPSTLRIPIHLPLLRCAPDSGLIICFT